MNAGDGRHLTPVPDDPDNHAEGASKEPPRTFANIEAAVKDGTYLEILRTQQTEVARLLDEGAGSQTAQLHRTLISLTEKIREIEQEDLVGNRPRTPDEKFTGRGAG